MIMRNSFIAVSSCLFLLSTVAWANEAMVSSRKELIEAVSTATPGTTIKIAPGKYAGGIRIRELKGTTDHPITIVAQEANDRPVFEGGQSGLQLTKCEHVILKQLKIKGATGNGINIDDGGNANSPAYHITLEDLDILETGPKGNRDGIKLSGLDQFVVRLCRIAGWGGSAIDMVGCHHGIVEQCQFEGREGFSQSNAVQMKGGSSDLVVRKNVFRNVGHRSINIGGNTGLDYFRPAATDYEATRIEVAGNQFLGSMAPIVWATSRGGYVHHNTIVHPSKWVLRILQENNTEPFAPSQGGRFENNVIVCNQSVRVPVNIGGGTAPETFAFKDNYWLTSSNRPPQLPTAETGGEHALYRTNLDLEAVFAGQAEQGRGAAGLGQTPIFTCDFESPTWYNEWDLKKETELARTIGGDDERKFVPLKGKSLRIKVPKGGHYGASLQYAFKKRTGSEPEKVYFRYYLRFADDWKPERGGKLPGIAGTYGRAGWGGRRVNGTDGWSARGLFRGQNEGKTPIGYYCYHADMKGKYGSEWRWENEDRGLLENNRWYCIEQFAKMNTPGKNNGILRGRVDGELAFERTDVRMRDTNQLKIETVWLNIYYGGTWKAQSDYHLYIDDVVIAREPIGLNKADH